MLIGLNRLHRFDADFSVVQRANHETGAQRVGLFIVIGCDYAALDWWIELSNWSNWERMYEMVLDTTDARPECIAAGTRTICCTGRPCS